MYGSQQTDVDEKCRVPESELESELTRHLSSSNNALEAFRVKIGRQRESNRFFGNHKSPQLHSLNLSMR